MYNCTVCRFVTGAATKWAFLSTAKKIDVVGCAAPERMYGYLTRIYVCSCVICEFISCAIIAISCRNAGDDFVCRERERDEKSLHYGEFDWPWAMPFDSEWKAKFNSFGSETYGLVGSIRKCFEDVSGPSLHACFSVFYAKARMCRTLATIELWAPKPSKFYNIHSRQKLAPISSISFSFSPNAVDRIRRR